MNTLKRVARINVELPESMATTIDWSEPTPFGTYIGEVHGLAIYTGRGDLDQAISLTSCHVIADEFEEIYFTDTLRGSKICKDLGILLNHDDGLTGSALDYVSRYGTAGRCDVLDRLRDSIVNAIKFNLLDGKTGGKEGTLYPICGYYVMYDTPKLFLVDGNDYREYR